jgi:hypothetical protein
MEYAVVRRGPAVLTALACLLVFGVAAAGSELEHPRSEEPIRQDNPKCMRPRQPVPVRRRAGTPVPLGTDSVIKDDFLVNDESWGGARQEGPVAATAPDGRFVIVWYDWRDGNADCWFQRFDSSGARTGTNQRANTDPTMNWQGQPAIAAGDDGRFVLCWSDRRILGNGDLFGQRYDSEANPAGDNFPIGDSAPQGDQLASGIHIGPGRGMLVAWDDRRNDIFGDIYGQFLDSSGALLDSNFRVNDDPIGIANQYEPAVSGDDSGRYVVAWMDGRGLSGSDWNVFAQRFDARGNRLGANLQVTTDDSIQWRPCVAATKSGTFLVGWEDIRAGPGDTDVYARLYGADGQPAGDEFQVNDDPGVAGQVEPEVAANRFGEFLVVWADTRNGRKDIYAQMYAADGDTLGGNFLVCSVAVSGTPDVLSSAAARPDGGFVVVWGDFRGGDCDVYARLVSRDRRLVGESFRVNDDSASSQQRVSSVAMTPEGSFIVSWEDERSGPGNLDAYCAVLDRDGNARGPSLRLNDDAGTASQNYTAAAAGRDRFLVTWTDGRSNHNIYGQLVDTLGRAIGGNLIVNCEPGGHSRSHSYCAMDDGNRSVVVWADGRPTFGYKVYCRRFDGTGSPLGPDFCVQESIGPQAIFPSVSANGSGRFVVSWMDYRNTAKSRADVYCRVFGDDGSPLTGDIRVDADPGDFSQGYPSCAMAGDNGFAVCWEETGHASFDVALQWFDSTGARKGDYVIVNDGPRPAVSYSPTCRFGPDGRLVVMFNDERSILESPDMYGQVFKADHSRMGRNQIVNSPKLFPGNAHWSLGSNVGVSAGTVASAWTDNRRHKGWDIFAKLMDWELIGMAETPVSSGPARILVRPTVSDGLVRLSLPLENPVRRIQVFDPAGRRVFVEELPRQNAVLDLRHLAPGVYVVTACTQDETPALRSKLVVR